MKYFDYFKGIVFGLILVGAVSYVSAQSGWSPATEHPPAGNEWAPLNVSLTTQEKEGVLVVGGMVVTDGGLSIIDGTQGDGKVFTSDAIGQGQWRDWGATDVHVTVYSKTYIEGGSNPIVLGIHAYCAQLNDHHGHDTNVGNQANTLTVNTSTGTWTFNRSPNGNNAGVVCFDILGANVTYKIAR